MEKQEKIAENFIEKSEKRNFSLPQSLLLQPSFNIIARVAVVAFVAKRCAKRQYCGRAMTRATTLKSALNSNQNSRRYRN